MPFFSIFSLSKQAGCSTIFYSTLCLASPHMRHADNHAVAAQRLRKRCPSRVRHRHTHRLSRSTGLDPPWASPRHRRIPALGFSPAQSSCSAGRTRAELDTALRRCRRSRRAQTSAGARPQAMENTCSTICFEAAPSCTFFRPT